MPELMTAKELEALLRIDVKTIYGYVQRGVIPYVRIQSNVRFVKQEIDEWIRRHSYSHGEMRDWQKGNFQPRRRGGTPHR